MGTERKASEITSFTVDAEVSGIQEMPSVTKLLNRKKLEKAATSTSALKSAVPTPPPFTKHAPPTGSPPPMRIGAASSAPAPALEIRLESVEIAPISPSALSLSLAPPPDHSQSAEPQAHAHPAHFSDGGSTVVRARTQSGIEIPLSFHEPHATLPERTRTDSRRAAPSNAAPVASARVGGVRPAMRKNLSASSQNPLAAWNLAQLAGSNDSLAQALVRLANAAGGGAHAALFLAVQPAVAGELPRFQSSAQWQADARLPLWAGVQWNPAWVPELWNPFIQAGAVELPPPGTVTHLKSNRNVMRGAFGAAADEWLLLLRVGSAQSLRGMLAVLSRKSLITEAQSLRALLESAEPKSGPIAKRA